MKLISAAILACFLAMPAATATTNSTDYDKGYSDGYAAALVALSGDLSEDQYAEIMAALQEIRDKMDKKESSNGKKTHKTISLIKPAD